MKISKTLTLLILIGFLLSSQKQSRACSMYKITVEGKTMVGCNEDAWRTTSRIWFQNAKTRNEYGAAFTGSRKVKLNQFAPQSGMNEVGLTFSRLTSYYPKNNNQAIDKKEITNEVRYLTDILHKCATVKDVKRFIDQYDRSIFIDDVFIYIDSSGKYLVVEPYNFIEGDDDSYVLSNFCPSITKHEEARKIDRYRNGEDYINTNKIEASFSYCSDLSNTMHVCRNRNGDGTLLTSIWDTKNGLVNLYFYHSYDSTVQFNLAEELAKGDHMLHVASLFPVNPEFERLSSYKTPFNTPSLRILLVIVGGILTLLFLVFTVVFIRNRKTVNDYKILVVTSVLNLLLTVYFFVLATNINIYYFDAPYKHYSSNFISTFSYFPLLLLLSIIPIVIYTIRFIKPKRRKSWVKNLLVINNLIYITSILGFAYWGLFHYLN